MGEDGPFEFLGGLMTWLPLLLGLLSWAAVRLRKSQWGRALAERYGLRQREHETEAEFHWRRGSVWLTTAVIFGLLAYVVGRRWVEHGAGASAWELIFVIASAVIGIWAAANAARAFWVSRRASNA